MTAFNIKSLAGLDEVIEFDFELFDRLLEELVESHRFRSFSIEEDQGGVAIGIIIENKRNGRLNKYELDKTHQRFKLICTIIEGEAE